MKYIAFLFLLLLPACQNKDKEPELDYVKMEIFPSFLPPSTINLDIKNKLLIFNNHSYLNFINENGGADFELKKRKVEFLYIELNEEEISKINYLIDQRFLNSIIRNNEESLTSPDEYFGIINDGISVKFNIVKNKDTFSSDNYLILDHEELLKISEVLKIIQKHSKLEENKKYLESLITR